MNTATLTIEALKNQFGGNQWPQFSNLTVEESTVSIDLVVQPDLEWFNGHFPDQPVLAGVVQVHWAVSLCQCFYPISGAFKQINNLKFKTVVLPDTCMRLQFEETVPGEKIKFRYQAITSTEIYSEGRLVFA